MVKTTLFSEVPIGGVYRPFYETAMRFKKIGCRRVVQFVNGKQAGPPIALKPHPAYRVVLLDAAQEVDG